MGHVVNVVMITAQLSSMNSALYVASRSLVNLATRGRAPGIFARTTANGTPIYALVFSNALGLLAMLNYTAGPGKVFTYIVTISGSATYVAWAAIGVIHVRFRRAWAAQGHRVEELPFRAYGYPWGTGFVIAVNVFLVVIAGYSDFVGGFHAVDFVVNYVVIAVFVVLYVGWKLVKGTRVVPLTEVDLVTGRREGLLNPRTTTAAAGVATQEMGVVVTVVGGDGDDGKGRKVPWYIKVKRTIFA